MGTPGHPCDIYSRWRRISFVNNDALWWTENILRISGSGPYTIEFNGWVRTIAPNLTIDHDNYRNYTFDPSFDYHVCGGLSESIGGRLRIQLEDGNCVDTQNPEVNLDGFEYLASNIFYLDENNLQSIDEWWYDGEPMVYSLQRSLFNDPSFSLTCSALPSVPEMGDEPIFAKVSNGTWLLFDPRLRVETNTKDSPLNDGGKKASTSSGGVTSCSNAPQSFLNKDSCQLSTNACKPSSNNQVDIDLDNSTISAINTLSGRYVYAIKGLLVKYEGINLDHPCTPGLRSRWVPKNLTDCNPTPLYTGTNNSLSYLLSNSYDRNEYIRGKSVIYNSFSYTYSKYK